ncbi:MAG: lipid-A-disaccharide synthase [Steroidobacteraceae bacterium]
MARESAAPCIALVAGEASGDLLGAALIEALRELAPLARFVGVAGPRMRAAGCEVIAPSEELAVMGLAEVLAHLPRLLRLRFGLRRKLSALRPDVFVGIDAPEFNLGLARQLKRAGIPTVQYVSPQVWAWRQGRVRSIGQSVDLVLCLLPFEAQFYEKHALRAVFVGHPLADSYPLHTDRAAARAALGLATDACVVAILPGSRLSEVKLLGPPFARAASDLSKLRADPKLEFIAPMASPAVRDVFERTLRGAGVVVRLLDGQAPLALAAADVVLVASGTATLETLLSKRPMVAAYRMNSVTAFVLRQLGLVKVRYFSQPNLLTTTPLVPEFLQEQVKPLELARALSTQLDDRAGRPAMEAEFTRVHDQLRRGGAALAARAVLELAQKGLR